MSENKLTFLSSKDPELAFAWSYFSDKRMENKEYGEVLQYMGTVLTPENTIRHEFRHRAVPGTNKRQYWGIPASPQFKIAVANNEFLGNWS
jgi:hypothetical protein